jgi:hypothetical protein
MKEIVIAIAFIIVIIGLAIGFMEMSLRPSRLATPVSEQYYCSTYDNYPMGSLPAKCIKYYTQSVSQNK